MLAVFWPAAAVASVGLHLICIATVPAIAFDAAPSGNVEPNYLTSPYHRKRVGNGQIIPCRCRFKGRDYPVGEIVCMTTHLGTVLTRCDLVQNNTSWIPSSEPCEISDARSTIPAVQSQAPHIAASAAVARSARR